MTDERYRNTIDWFYESVPEEKQDGGERAAVWVGNHLVWLRHWDALEEHLAFRRSLEDAER